MIANGFTNKSFAKFMLIGTGMAITSALMKLNSDKTEYNKQQLRIELLKSNFDTIKVHDQNENAVKNKGLNRTGP